MAGRIIVETPQQHAAWLMRDSAPAAIAGTDPAPEPTAANRSMVAEVLR
jgi:hypothetical protein